MPISESVLARLNQPFYRLESVLSNQRIENAIRAGDRLVHFSSQAEALAFMSEPWRPGDRLDRAGAVTNCTCTACRNVRAALTAIVADRGYYFSEHATSSVAAPHAARCSETALMDFPPAPCDRRFGVEIECVMPAAIHRDIQNQARRAGFNIERTNPPPYGWAYKSDGSINLKRSQRNFGAWEIVSAPMRGLSGYREVYRMADWLSANGAQVNMSCGLHVHFEASEMTFPQLLRLAKLHIRFEHVIDTFVAASRRGSSSNFCRSNRAYASHGYYGVRAAVNACARLQAEASSVHDICNLVSGGERYAKLNFCPLANGRQTIEVRQHQGSLNAEKITKWMRLWHHIFAFAAISDDTLIFRSSANDPKMAADTEKLFEMIGLPSEDRQYFKARQRALLEDMDDGDDGE